jgi:hypothetical protein
MGSDNEQREKVLKRLLNTQPKQRKSAEKSGKTEPMVAPVLTGFSVLSQATSKQNKNAIANVKLISER